MRIWLRYYVDFNDIYSVILVLKIYKFVNNCINLCVFGGFDILRYLFLNICS